MDSWPNWTEGSSLVRISVQTSKRLDAMWAFAFQEVRGIQSPNLPVALAQDLSHCWVMTASCNSQSTDFKLGAKGRLWLPGTSHVFCNLLSVPPLYTTTDMSFADKIPSHLQASKVCSQQLEWTHCSLPCSRAEEYWRGEATSNFQLRTDCGRCDLRWSPWCDRTSRKLTDFECSPWLPYQGCACLDLLICCILLHMVFFLGKTWIPSSLSFVSLWNLWARFVHEKNQKVLVPIVGCCHGSTLADAASLKAAEFDNCCVAFPGTVSSMSSHMWQKPKAWEDYAPNFKFEDLGHVEVRLLQGRWADEPIAVRLREILSMLRNMSGTWRALVQRPSQSQPCSALSLSHLAEICRD